MEFVSVSLLGTSYVSHGIKTISNGGKLSCQRGKVLAMICELQVVNKSGKIGWGLSVETGTQSAGWQSNGRCRLSGGWAVMDSESRKAGSIWYLKTENTETAKHRSLETVEARSCWC